MRVFIIACAVGLLASPTRADEQARARKAFQNGVQAYSSGRMTEALESFEEAYRIKPNPVVLYNIGQAEADLGKSASAAAHFETYLREAKGVPPERRNALKAEIPKLRAKAARVDLGSTPENARVLLDNVMVGMTPLAGPLYVDPGRHHIVVAKDGYRDFATDIESVSGEPSRVQAVLVAHAGGGETPAVLPAAPQVVTPAREPAPVAPGPMEEPARPVPMQQVSEGGISQVWFWTALGLTVASAGAATATGLMALDRSNQYNDPLTPASRRADLRSSGENLAHVTDALIAASAVGAIATVFLYFKTDWGVAPTDNGVAIAGRF